MCSWAKPRGDDGYRLMLYNAQGKRVPNPNGRPAEPLGRRFWSKVLIQDFSGNSCWEWQAAKNADGYGVFSSASIKGINKRGRYELAHRMSFRLIFKFDIAPHQRILHRCDNPGCVRPQHLFIGTQQENIADATAKKRMRGLKGVASGMAKLDDEKVRAIKALIKAKYTQVSLGKLFGVTQACIYAISKGKTWTHIKD